MLVLLASAGLLAGGCTSAPKPLTATRSREVALNAEAKRTRVTAQVAEELTLLLPPIEQPGYGWRLVGHDSRMLRQTSELRPAATPDGHAMVKFIAQRVVSRTTIRFVLVRAAREDSPVDVHEVEVTVAAAPVEE